MWYYASESLQKNMENVRNKKNVEPEKRRKTFQNTFFDVQQSDMRTHNR